MKKSSILLAGFLALTVQQSQSQNPYLPLWEFIPDGEPYVFEDPDHPGEYRVYVYGSHDMLVNSYCGLDQVVWSASVNDLTHWRLDGTIFQLTTDATGKKFNAEGRPELLFAPDVAEMVDKEGHKVYYLYPNIQGSRNNVVAKSNRPDGPFEVCNWDPNDPTLAVGPFGFDPAAFVDDDGRAYGYWGFNEAWCAELDTETMATVKPGTQPQRTILGRNEDNTFRFFEASSIRKIKDKYVFIYSRWTNEGEFGLPATNYTLAYCYSNNPMGPWTYGGTIIDGRGRERRPDGTVIATATPNGNTHGSICEINGKWWVFYHRQAGTTEYSRQAMVAPIEVEVMEGPSGYVRISEAEFTSEGFMTEGLDPYTCYPAGIACYMVGPEPAHAEYPNVIYPGSHTQIIRDQYHGESDVYDLSINRCPMVNNTDGSAFGYKYYNFSRTYGQKGLKLAISYQPEGVAGQLDIYLDRPNEAEGGVRIGQLRVPAKATGKSVEALIPVEQLKYYNGKHALYFVFTSPTKGQSICQVNDLCFRK